MSQLALSTAMMSPCHTDQASTIAVAFDTFLHEGLHDNLREELVAAATSSEESAGDPEIIAAEAPSPSTNQPAGASM